MNIVIVFPKREIALKINSILTQNGFHVAAVCGSGGKAIQAIENMDAGIVISAIRYKDMMYHTLKEELPQDFEMIIIGTPGQWDDYGDDDLVFLPVPFKAYDLVELVEDYIQSLERRIKKRKNRPKARNEREQGLIEQAKERLMISRNWSEEEAHRYLQKSSMDAGRSLVETAACILEIF